MSTQNIEIGVQLELSSEYSDEELNELTQRLYQTLLETDADRVEMARGGEIPTGAKGEPITIGAIVLGVSVAIAPKVIEIIHGWFSRQHIDVGTFKVTLADGTSASFPLGTPDQEIKDKIGLLSNELKRISDG